MHETLKASSSGSLDQDSVHEYEFVGKKKKLKGLTDDDDGADETPTIMKGYTNLELIEDFNEN